MNCHEDSQWDGVAFMCPYHGRDSYDCLREKCDAALLQAERMRKALQEIRAKLERSHDGGCILPLRDMVNDALEEGVIGKRADEPRNWADTHRPGDHEET